MNKFPTQFADLLNANGKKILKSKTPFTTHFIEKTADSVPAVRVPRVVSKETLMACFDLLETHVGPHLTKSRYNEDLSYYEARQERLIPDSESRHYFYVDGQDDNVRSPLGKKHFVRLLKDIGFYDCFLSDSFYEFITAVTGLELEKEGNGVQSNRYTNGDYMQLHTDYYNREGNATPKALPRMCVNLHIHAFTNVLHQYVLHQTTGGHLNGMDNTCDKDIGGIVLYNLPFFHQVLPLVPSKPDVTGIRWLMMGEAYLTEKQTDTLIETYPDHWQIKQMVNHLPKRTLASLLKASKKNYESK